MITLRVDPSEVLDGLQVLGKEAPVAIARAINRTVKNVNTAMVRVVSQSLRIKQAYVRARLLQTTATRSRLTAHIAASRKPIPLMAFGARGPYPSRGKGRGVTAKTAQRVYPHAFIAVMPSGHRGVFQRVGRQRLKIRELREASVAAVFVRHEAVGQARGHEQLVKNLRHEVEYALTQKVQRAVKRGAGL